MIHPLFAKLLAPFMPASDGKPAIVVNYWPKPIPMREYDYCAYREGEEERGDYGFGATEAEAIAELLKLEDEGYYT